jgi:hypothetical protein
VKNLLNLSYIENITDIKVFNLLGQQIVEQKFDNTLAQLDLSALQSGTYLVKVSAANQTKTIKITKE